MNLLARTTYRTLLKQARRVDCDIATRTMLCASPIHAYDHRSGEWMPFEGAVEWNDSRKTVDNSIRELNGGKEWFHPPVNLVASQAGKKRYPNWNGEPVGELAQFIRTTYRNSPLTTQSLNLAFSAVKCLNHTLKAAQELPAEVDREPLPPLLWQPSNFRVTKGVRWSQAESLLADGPPAGDGAAFSPSMKDLQFIVAHPLLPGFFRHAVCLVLRSSDEGAFAVVINKPLTSASGHIVPVWSAVPDQHPLLSKHLHQNPIMIGGPVSSAANTMEQSMILLHTFPTVSGAVRVSADPSCELCVGGDMGDMVRLLESGKAVPENFMCLLGYSGWGSGQLEGEVERGSWICVEHTATCPSDGGLSTASAIALSATHRALQNSSVPVVDPKATWLNFLRVLGGPYEKLDRLHNISKHLLADEDEP